LCGLFCLPNTTVCPNSRGFRNVRTYSIAVTAYTRFRSSLSQPNVIAARPAARPLDRRCSRLRNKEVVQRRFVMSIGGMLMVRDGSKSQSTKLIVLLVFMLMCLPNAQASILSVGGTAPSSPLFPSGPTLASTSGTITTPTFSADYGTWVVRDPRNTFCANCLDFIYVFTDNGPDVNERYSMSSFVGFNIDAGTNPSPRSDYG
jgi:hypothetical protein